MKKTILIFLSIFCLASITVTRGGPTPEKTRTYEELTVFGDVLALIQKNYVDEVPAKKLIYGSLKGLLHELDPYSQFMEPHMYKEMKIETEGEFGGLGVEITTRHRYLAVVTALEGTPAAKAGVLPGDRIIKIGGKATHEMSLMEATKLLRGKRGSKVALSILRPSEKRIIEMEIVRDVIKIDSVRNAVMLTDVIGYVRIVQFQESTMRDFGKALDVLKGRGMQYLILDLRNNPGGLFKQAIDVADLFIPEGKVIVSTRGRMPEQNMEFKATQRLVEGLSQCVVLINEGSASGAEIVAGALRDWKQAILIGKKTFGKGSVQTVVPLRDGSAVRLTTARYFTPLGISIHGEGVEPDIEVEAGVLETIEELVKEQLPDSLEMPIGGDATSLGASTQRELFLAAELLKDKQVQRAVDLLGALHIVGK